MRFSPAKRLIWLLAVCLLTGCARKHEYPARPIELVCPWSAGGGTDLVSRQVASQLERELGVPVNVVNATGGGGVTGHTRGATAAPDGYTLTMTTVELNMLHWRGLTNIAPNSFQPLVLLNKDDAALFVRAEAPWQNVKELEDEIRKRPGQLKASGTAQGGVWHVALAGWLNAEGIPPQDVVWISINGSAPSLQELMAEGIDMACCSVPEARSLLEAGKIRCLGVMADQRLGFAPGVPTFKEQGINWTLGGWRGLAIPPDVPPDRVQLLSDSLEKIAASEEFAQFMDSAGFNRTIAGPSGFESLLAETDKQFGEILNSDAFRSVHNAPLGPMAFPLTLAIGGALIASTLLVSRARSSEQPAPPAESSSTGNITWQWAIAPAWIILFALAAPVAGFLATAFVLTALSMWLLGTRWWVALLTAALCVPLVYYLFAVILRVSLPLGEMPW